MTPIDLNNQTPLALTFTPQIYPLLFQPLLRPDLTQQYTTQYNTLTGQITNPSKNNPSIQTPTLKLSLTAYGINQLSGQLTNSLTNNIFGTDSELGRNFGNLFSSSINSGVSQMSQNILKGEALMNGVGKNATGALAGAAAGMAANYIGKGITSAMGDSRLGRAIGTGTATGLGTLGGTALQGAITGIKTASGTLTGAAGAAKALSNINPYALGATVLGTALGAATGPSKEYGGKYGGITRGLDTAYDFLTIGANFVPGGLLISGAMTLNKGLSNIFGSTDGMCVCAGTKVFTNTGEIVNIEDLVLNLGIIGWDEKSHEILPNTIAGIVRPKLKECLEIELKNGTILRCSIDHPILSNIKEKAETHRINGKRIAYRDWEFRRADKLKVGNWVGLANNIDYWGTEELPNAYLVGMLIGDGTYTYEQSCKLWTADPSTWKYLEENNLAVLIGQYTPESSNGKYLIENRDYRIINGMLLVKDLGIAYQSGKNKTLPKNIGKYNKDSICKLIAGLYDTDGSLSVNEEKGVYKITFYLSNLNLLENLKLLLLKLGIFTTIYIRKASINKMSNGRTINSNLSYRLEVTDRNSIINFYKNIPLNIDYKKEHLERIYKLVLPKLDKDHCDLSGAKLYKIVSIKSIGILTVYNLEASETHTYIANGIITHNTRLDAILGSAFMPAPVKWLNMAGAKTTSRFDNLSWLNSERTTDFMQNAFGDLQDKFNKASLESSKTYGTFSRHAYNKALENLDFANSAFNSILNMADTKEIQDIKSLYMSSINNQRYAQNISGGWTPMLRGKQGMKILNNQINHNFGQRLLSGAALIDNKQMILSAQGEVRNTNNNNRRDLLCIN